MTWRRLLLASILIAALAAAAAGVVVAGLWAALAALSVSLGLPGAAAVIAIIMALIFAGLATALAPRGPKPSGAHEVGGGFASSALAAFKARPWLTAGFGGGVIILATLNPRYLGHILRAVVWREPRFR